jgi:hypothetical protein
METTEKNYTPVYIGVGIGFGIGLVICGVMYLITTYRRNKKIAQLKAVHEADKRNALEAQSISNRLDNLRSKAEMLAKIKRDLSAGTFPTEVVPEPEKTETITE